MRKEKGKGAGKGLQSGMGGDPGHSGSPGIGIYAESSLHASLKLLVAEPGDSFEAPVEGKVADILRASGDIVEVQTGAFARLRPKLQAFCPGHRVKIVYPLISEKIIHTLDPETGETLSKRKSPKKGRIEDIFEELVHFPELLAFSGLSLEIHIVRMEELRVRDGKGSWRRKFTSIHDKRLLEVLERRILEKPEDLLGLFPRALPREFTSSDIAALTGRDTRFGGIAAYVLARSGLAVKSGKRGRSILYRLSAPQAQPKRGGKTKAKAKA